MIARPALFTRLELLLFLFCLALFLPRMTHSLSQDEAGQFALCNRSAKTIATTFADAQNHPLYGLAAHAAMEVLPLPPVWSFRAPALIAGIAIPFAFAACAPRIIRREAALAVGIMLVSSDLLGAYSTAGRGYSMLVLAAILLNRLALGIAQSPEPKRIIAYVLIGAAAGYTHLWSMALLIAHGVFAAASLLLKRSSARSAASLIVACGAAALISACLYCPMRDGILATLGHRRETPPLAELAGAFFELARFGNWTVAVYLAAVPILLVSIDRMCVRAKPDRGLALLHAIIVVVHIGIVVLHSPANFGGRFLMGILPTYATAAAWMFSGYWDESGAPRASAASVWGGLLIGFALGVLAASAPISHQFPEGARVNEAGVDQGYFDRELAKGVGPTAAIAILAAGALVAASASLARQRPSGLDSRVWAIVLTASLALTTIPLIIGPDATRPQWLFELHPLAIALVALAAWLNRSNRPQLARLRYAIFIALAALAARQFGTTLMVISVEGVCGVVTVAIGLIFAMKVAQSARDDDRPLRLAS